jgi:Rrf2 family protein
MTISTKGRYGLRAFLDIAAQEDGGYVSLKTIAERLDLSENYLEQLASVMKKAGFLKSVRGSQGGYAIGCDPLKTSVGDLLRALEGEMYPVDCLSEKKKYRCSLASCDKCVSMPLWKKMYDSFNETLDSFILSEMIDEYKKEINKGEYMEMEKGVE